MKKRFFLLLLLQLILFQITYSQVSDYSNPCKTCEELKDIKLPDVTIVSTEITEAGHCRVMGRISKEINFELLLPAKWNRRFLMGGGGGFVGSVTNQFRYSADLGYATSGTDTGHEGPVHRADWALNNMERQLNFGKLAVHRTATVSRALINYYYGSFPEYSYFMGASRGGGQALIEAQEYPEDFNGIVSFAPAISWTAFGAKFIQNTQKIYPDPNVVNKPVITIDNLKLLNYNVLKQFDELDGISDSIINDPSECNLDFSRLPVCTDTLGNPECFTIRQLDAIKTIYSPLVNMGDTIYPGFPVGGENEPEGWSMWITGSDTSKKIQGYQYYFGTGIFKYFIFNDPNWDYSKYNFKDFFRESRYASAFLDANQTDYNEFKKRGGKLILVHGWSDPALSAYSTINHYKLAERSDKDLRSFMRLFLLPGVLHYQGGSGPDKADWIKTISDWVERGIAPDKVVMTKSVNDQVLMSRPVFPYPIIAVYNRTGNANKESSFSPGRSTNPMIHYH